MALILSNNFKKSNYVLTGSCFQSMLLFTAIFCYLYYDRLSKSLYFRDVNKCQLLQRLKIPGYLLCQWCHLHLCYRKMRNIKEFLCEVINLIIYCIFEILTSIYKLIVPQKGKSLCVSNSRKHPTIRCFYTVMYTLYPILDSDNKALVEKIAVV